MIEEKNNINLDYWSIAENTPNSTDSVWPYLTIDAKRYVRFSTVCFIYSTNLVLTQTWLIAVLWSIPKNVTKGEEALATMNIM